MPSIDNSFLTNNTSLYVTDGAKSASYYKANFSMSLLKETDFPELGYKSYFLALDDKEHPFHGVSYTERPGVLELREAYSKKSAKIVDGNSDPYRGFGHICFSVDNIAECEKVLLAQGCDFKKKLSDGRQRNIAFVLDPDGYWIELVENGIDQTEGVYRPSSLRFNHSMIRVKDPKKSLEFYKGVLGMKLFSISSHPAASFDLYFLGYEHDPSYVEESKEVFTLQSRRYSIVELTHNYGTEKDDSFKGYYPSNVDKDILGFAHVGISCKDPAKLCKEIEAETSVKFVTPYNSNPSLKNIAVVQDPDGYQIQILGPDSYKSESKL